MLSILVSNDCVQNNQLVFFLNSPDLVEKRKALSLLDIFPQESRIIIKITMESSAKGRKLCLASLPPPKLKKNIIFSPASGIMSQQNIRQQTKPIRKVENLDSKHELLLSMPRVYFSH